MPAIQELIEERAILQFIKPYLGYAAGTKLIAVKERVEANRQDDEIIFRIKGSFTTNTIRSDIFWNYISLC